MPEGPDGKTIIIVKKVSGHGGHHGGAWKVAYADFVTAMMAFFMVLWLVNSASVITRERIANYFKRPGIFEAGSGTPLEIGGAGILPDAFSPPAEENSKVGFSKNIYGVKSTRGDLPEGFNSGDGNGNGNGEEEAEKIETVAAGIRQAVAEIQAGHGEGGDAAARVLGDVEVKVDQRGLHIEIMDTASASMFELGSNRIKVDAEGQLAQFAQILKTLPNPIDIEGHTDSRPFSGDRRLKYDNWDLSTDRANSARRILVAAGIKDTQIARVVGYADQRHRVKEDPFNPTNRRISISMRYSELASTALKGSNTQETLPKPIAPIKVDTVPAPAILQEAGKRIGVPEPIERKEQLQVDVHTSAPEGNPVSENTVKAPRGPEDGVEGKPVWIEKDKIFGKQNPFAGAN